MAAFAGTIRLDVSTDPSCSLRPATSTAEGDLLAFDGRLDNRADLAAIAGLTGPLASDDVGVLLEAMRRSCRGCARRMVGDFAFAYWNPRERRLTLGRDAAGARTIYWHHSQHRFLFGTDIGALVDAAAVGPNELDEDYIAGFLGAHPDARVTAYTSIRAVRPGHLVTLGATGEVDEEEVWSLSADPIPVSARHDEEYAEECARLFIDGVRCRMRSEEAVVAELSGGLDSSSVVCVANHLRRVGEVQTASFSTVSHIFDVSRTSDESDYIAAVESHCGLQGHHVRESACPRFGGADASRRTLHTLSLLAAASGFESALCARMQTLGARVLLSGLGGDEVFYPSHDPLPGLADQWRRWQFADLHRSLLVWSGALRQSYATLAWRSWRFGRDRRALSLITNTGRHQLVPSWVHPRLLDRVQHLGERHEARLRPYAMPSVRDSAAGYYAAIGAIADGSRQEFDVRQVTYPCLHRPLVEFLHAVPFGAKLRPHENRALQKRALGWALPARIATRQGKADGREALMRALRDDGRDWEAFFAHSEAADRQFIDPARLNGVLRRFRGGIGSPEGLTKAIALETWLRSLRAAGSRSEHRSWPRSSRRAG